ncbi:hypothetical protein FIV42_24585 [Persicimonas caeni]|uniref:Glycine zipper family protein n=1 Tax=Persicimonas caeni TaxID=2292766 RepID=A0A4Y6PZR5_PERCE|nr:hypothetical protein [Persicimonas caeni]QDG53804.1 hypothetical protein FIV42_24585 [Persicimonas caeni]QED35025.1 hypothetical protein FRD00_24580 [Persicimonas caeni]
MTPRILAILAALLLCATPGCRSAQVQSDQSRAYYEYDRQLPTRWAIPPGTLVTVRLDNTLSTRHNRRGDHFNAWLVHPLVGPGGDVVVPAGAVVTGLVTGVKRSRGPADDALIRLDFRQLAFDGRSYPMRVEVVRARLYRDRERGPVRTGATIGAVSGALLGGIVGGDFGDAIVGGLLGAGAGSVLGLGASTVDAVIPRGSDLTLRTMSTVDLR